MYWPIMTDYQEAIQSPKLCFADSELREGRLDFDNLGLPRPISGNFACVYGLTYRNAKWAVRCFLQNNQDQENRYQYIHTYLAKIHSPYFVPFRYIHDGIRIKGIWYPILKMEWINGESLSAYIERNLANPGAIQSLSQKFLGMAEQLEKNSIAHGDLQHGNIIIAGGELKLVDYDGMFVPGLEGMVSNEIGHPNYQHPIRSEKDFGPHLDRFSEWIIYLSLKALALDPSLWMNLKGGDENLLFRKADFINPDSSDNFKFLETGSNKDLGKIAYFLRAISSCTNIKDVPRLDAHALTKIDQTSIQAPRPESKDAVSGHSLWVMDYLDVIELEKIEFSGDADVERRSLSVLALALSATLVFFVLREIDSAVFLVIAILEPLLSFAFLYFRYNRNNRVKKKQGLILRKKAILEKLLDLNSAIAAEELQYQQITDQENEKIAALNQSANRLAQMEQTEISAVNEEVNQQLQKLNHQFRQTNQEETAEFRSALSSIQEDFIKDQLSNIPIEPASIHGFGSEMKNRLLLAGISTAADLEDYQVDTTNWQGHTRECAYLVVRGRGNVHVDGVGPAKAKALLAWRKEIEGQYQGMLPKIVPSDVTRKIREKFETKRSLLSAEIIYVKQQGNQNKRAIHARFKDDFERNRNAVKKIYRYYESKKSAQKATIAHQSKEKNRLDGEQASLDKQLSAYRRINFFFFLRNVLEI